MDNIFYVKAKSGSLVPATYLSFEGKFVVDRNLDIGRFNANLPRQDAIYNIDGSLSEYQNTNNFLIVPVNFDNYKTSRLINNISAGSPAPDVFNAGALIAAFEPGGFGDVQRNYRKIDGREITDGS